MILLNSLSSYPLISNSLSISAQNPHFQYGATFFTRMPTSSSAYGYMRERRPVAPFERQYNGWAFSSSVVLANHSLLVFYVGKGFQNSPLGKPN